MSSFSTKSAKISAANAANASVDAFNRWRVSNPINIFESQLQYNDAPLLWETIITGGGTTTHLPDESALEMTCTTSSGDKVIRQTFQYFRYQPGKSHLITMTGCFGTQAENVRKRIGYFDGYNGIYFEQEGSVNKVVLRSSVSGATIDTEISQDDWNLDRFNGSGRSGVEYSSTLSQVFVIDLQWLGVGRVRMGIISSGEILYAHEFENANFRPSTYMTSANLPLRYEIENLDDIASSISMIQICASIASEGGLEEDKGFGFAASNGITAVAITTRASVLTIRPKYFFNSIKNRGNILPVEFAVISEDNGAFYEIILHGSLGGTPSWTSINANSLTEFSINKEIVTGGEVLASGYVPVGVSSRINFISSVFRSNHPLGSNYDGTLQDQLSIVCTSLTGTANIRASLNIRERY